MATATDKHPALSRRKRLLFVFSIFSFFFIVFLVLSEVALRSKGLKPWIDHRRSFTWTPAGRYHMTHPTLGYITRPGEFTFTFSVPNIYKFKSTHLSNGLRITHPLSTYPGKSEKEIWIFGCSFTQGWTLSDEETYAWLLQEKFPDYEVTNFGVDGYSTAQSLLQFREALANGKKPTRVIVSYGSFHDQRNTQTRAWLKTRLTHGAGDAYGVVNLPYARLTQDNKTEILYTPLRYDLAPLLRRSVLANFLDDRYNRSLEGNYHSLEVTRALIDEFSSSCKANDIEFVLAGILRSPETAAMLEHYGQQGIKTVDISVDFTDQRNTNFPYDGHPSAIANKEYARKLAQFLQQK